MFIFVILHLILGSASAVTFIDDSGKLVDTADACPDGTFFDVSDIAAWWLAACTDCTPLYYRQYGTTLTCTSLSDSKIKQNWAASKCQVGSFFNGAADADVCTPCNKGYIDHDKNSSTPCTACTEGTYSEGFDASCVACAAGTTDHDKNSSTPCTACTRGTYGKGGHTSCVACAAGTADPDSDPSTPCEARPVGYEYVSYVYNIPEGSLGVDDPILKFDLNNNKLLSYAASGDAAGSSLFGSVLLNDFGLEEKIFSYNDQEYYTDHRYTLKFQDAGERKENCLSTEEMCFQLFSKLKRLVSKDYSFETIDKTITEGDVHAPGCILVGNHFVYSSPELLSKGNGGCGNETTSVTAATQATAFNGRSACVCFDYQDFANYYVSVDASDQKLVLPNPSYYEILTSEQISRGADDFKEFFYGSEYPSVLSLANDISRSRGVNVGFGYRLKPMLHRQYSGLRDSTCKANAESCAQTAEIIGARFLNLDSEAFWGPKPPQGCSISDYAQRMSSDNELILFYYSKSGDPCGFNGFHCMCLPIPCSPENIHSECSDQPNRTSIKNKYIQDGACSALNNPPIELCGDGTQWDQGSGTCLDSGPGYNLGAPTQPNSAEIKNKYNKYDACLKGGPGEGDVFDMSPKIKLCGDGTHWDQRKKQCTLWRWYAPPPIF